MKNHSIHVTIVGLNSRNTRLRGALLGGAYGAQNGFKNFRWAIRIPNLCLVLKLDNGKVVSIANDQTES